MSRHPLSYYRGTEGRKRKLLKEETQFLQRHGSEKCRVHLRTCNSLEKLGYRLSQAEGDEVCLRSWHALHAGAEQLVLTRRAFH